MVDKSSEFYNRSINSWVQDNVLKFIIHIMKVN